MEIAVITIPKGPRSKSAPKPSTKAPEVNQDDARGVALVDYVDVPTVKPRRAAKRVIESESEEEREEAPERGATAKEASEGEQEKANGGPIGGEEECGPYYLCRMTKILEERDEANQDAENAQNRESALLQQITDLETQLASL
ncbi:unnamed protein product [Calypogeia fissa]